MTEPVFPPPFELGSILPPKDCERRARELDLGGVQLACQRDGAYDSSAAARYVPEGETVRVTQAATTDVVALMGRLPLQHLPPIVAQDEEPAEHVQHDADNPSNPPPRVFEGEQGTPIPDVEIVE